MIPENLWHKIVHLMPIVCVDVAIVRDGKVLLVRRSQEPAMGQWWIPGGRLVKGASLPTMAYTKALTETGLRCDVGPMVHWQELYFPTGPGGHEVHAVAFCFRLEPKGDGPIVLDGTSCDSAWCEDPGDFWADMGEGEPMPITLHPYVVECVRRAL